MACDPTVPPVFSPLEMIHDPEPLLAIARRATQEAILSHKRLGHTIVARVGDRIVRITPGEIVLRKGRIHVRPSRGSTGGGANKKGKGAK